MGGEVSQKGPHYSTVLILLLIFAPHLLDTVKLLSPARRVWSALLVVVLYTVWMMGLFLRDERLNTLFVKKSVLGFLWIYNTC